LIRWQSGEKKSVNDHISNRGRNFFKRRERVRVSMLRGLKTIERGRADPKEKKRKHVRRGMAHRASTSSEEESV